MNLFDFTLLTLFNTVLCILLPKIVSFDWSTLKNTVPQEIDNQGKIVS